MLLPLLQSNIFGQITPVEKPFESIDLAFVDESLNNIKRSLSVTAESISRERLVIDRAADEYFGAANRDASAAHAQANPGHGILTGVGVDYNGRTTACCG